MRGALTTLLSACHVLRGKAQDDRQGELSGYCGGTIDAILDRRPITRAERAKWLVCYGSSIRWLWDAQGIQHQPDPWDCAYCGTLHLYAMPECPNCGASMMRDL